MSKLSATAWLAHDVGLGASSGGQLFGRVALNPKLGVLDSGPERGKMLDAARDRYDIINIINVVSFSAAAAT